MGSSASTKTDGQRQPPQSGGTHTIKQGQKPPVPYGLALDNLLKTVQKIRNSSTLVTSDRSYEKLLRDLSNVCQDSKLNEDVNDIIVKAKKLEGLQQKRQEYLNKISEVAGARLKSNNPAIADLSDQNRPSKLAEKFSELYDNEWTDAAEELGEIFIPKDKYTDDDKERMAIKLLYIVTEKIYSECKEHAGQQLQKVKISVVFNDSETKNIAVETERKCRDFIRRNSDLTIKHITEILQEKVKDHCHKENFKGISFSETSDFKRTFKFFRLCVRLCWMMALQDPLIHMISEDDATVDVYRAYTRSGNAIDYIVWPSLLLHEGGPLLYKGVAQLKPVDKNENMTLKNANTAETETTETDRSENEHATNEKNDKTMANGGEKLPAKQQEILRNEVKNVAGDMSLDSV